jgi:hypothetical protein
MPVRQMTEPQIARWAQAVENQGVRVTRTKKGLLLRLPDGSTAMKHFTESDVRGPKNLAAQLRRAGVTSPDDKKPAALPKYITEGTITSKSRQKMLDFIESHAFPTMVFSKDIVSELGMDPGSVNRILYHCGFTVGETMGRKGRPWYTPERLLAMKQKDSEGEAIPDHARQIIDGARAAQAEVNQIIADAEAEHEQVIDSEMVDQNPPPMDPPPVPEPEVEKNSFEDIDFIDMRDSWVVDIDTLLGEHLSRMVKDRLGVLAAVGIDFEIRVWRKS